MGCPDVYYKEVLSVFLDMLGGNASKLKNVCELEDEILLEKENFIEKYFYYEAGRACNQVLNKALEQDGCDGVNACFGGLISFENFLGI